MNGMFEKKMVYRIWVTGYGCAVDGYLSMTTGSKAKPKRVARDFETAEAAAIEITRLTEEQKKLKAQYGDERHTGKLSVVAVAPAGSLGPMPVAELHIGRELRAALDLEFDEKWQDYEDGGLL
jgi:hypothetical protein